MRLGRGVWFAIPGMMGGFHDWLEQANERPCLITDTWSRVGGTIRPQAIPVAPPEQRRVAGPCGSRRPHPEGI
jgi:hypothetical protein